LFVTLLRIAEDPGTSFTFRQVGRLFFREVAGGIGLGLLAGYIAYRMIRAIRDYQTIFLISLALVVSISLIAGNLDVSIPLAAVTAGLVVGNRNLDKEGKTMEFLKRIWQLIDDVLNTILFVLIGLQLVVMPALHTYWLPGIFSILALLMARLASVSLPAIFLLRKPNMKNLFILTWAGLRGGISIAMALSLPASPFREIILAACYFIVIFSIIFQGLTLGKLVTRLTD
jgi:CPA1 family monovalent cation:H+ antiporter